MTDQELSNLREMLELAAKAANYEVKWIGERFLLWDGDGEYWYPSEDDGDAFRLATRLRLDISHNILDNNWVLVERGRYQGFGHVCIMIEDFDESERNEATRRAILKAAAEIGIKEKEYEQSN